jgi:small subunit ribosomal protein S18
MEKTDKTEVLRDDKKSRRDMIHFDYKNVELLKEYVNPHARILSRRRSKLTSRDQRSLANAIKRSRFMALTPYLTR